MRQERARLGPLSRGERNVLIAFGLTVGLWVLPGLVTLFQGAESEIARWLNQRMPESVAALMGVVLLFVLPVDWKAGRFTLTWTEASRIDWGTILLFGGGLALGEAMFTTGLARWMGEGLAHGLGAKSVVGLTIVFTLVGLLLSETTSNTAAATMVVPVAIAVAQAAGVSPLQPALGACLGASLGFMLPVSTPPNAIVFGSGCVPLLKMVRHGLVLDAVATVGVVVVVCWLVPLVWPG
jgi:sodium-dependent dicarboxylate transporter 2/3/5